VERVSQKRKRRLSPRPVTMIRRKSKGQERPRRRVVAIWERIAKGGSRCGSEGQVVIWRQAMGSQGR
jgi:hypothetical protein